MTTREVPLNISGQLLRPTLSNVLAHIGNPFPFGKRNAIARAHEAACARIADHQQHVEKLRVALEIAKRYERFTEESDIEYYLWANLVSSIEEDIARDSERLISVTAYAANLSTVLNTLGAE